MTADQEMTREDRLTVAARIVELSDEILSTDENPQYIALKIASGPNSNAVTVWSDHVSFFIRSTALLDKARADGFEPIQVKSTTPRNQDKYQFPRLSLNQILTHEALFREIVQESMRTIMDRRPKKK